MKGWDDYECEGQMTIYEFLDKEEPNRQNVCIDCLWNEGGNCVRCGYSTDCDRNACQLAITKQEGWHRIYYLSSGYCHGEYPLNVERRKIFCICQEKGGNYIGHNCEGKNGTFFFDSNSSKSFDEQIVAWIYEDDFE